MNDELDPEVFGDLPDPENLDETAEDHDSADSAEGGSAPLYPFIRGLGGSEQFGTYLCQDPLQDQGQVVQKLFSEELTRERMDWVEVGMAHLQRAAHPGLALVRDFGYEGNQAFLVRDYVTGAPLIEAMARASLPDILQAFYQILEILDGLYLQGIHHLRLHPGNLFWAADASGAPGQIKITDFGLATWLDKKLPGQTQTVGIAPYTAPEYAMNPYPDTRADLYSFGIVLYQALAKRLPFTSADPVHLMQQQLSQDPAPLSEVIKAPKLLSDFVAKLLSRDPASRYRDPREALWALVDIIGTVPEQLRVPPAFSGPEEAFLFKKFAKLFRRIILQGRRWAFRGPRGSGKTYFARWIQRYFWINRKDVRFYRGEDLYDAKGETILHPKEPLFIIIDNADPEEVEAWLETKPYLHVVLFGEELKWAQEDPRWQFFAIENLSPEAVNQVYENSWTQLSEKKIQTMYRGHQGLAGGMVEQARALQRQKKLACRSQKYQLTNDSISQLVSLQSKGLSVTLSSLPETYQNIYSFLALSRVPLSVSNLQKWWQGDSKLLHAELLERCREGVLKRQLWLGQEYFSWDVLAPKRLEATMPEPMLTTWLSTLEELEWYDGALRVLQGCLGTERIREDSGWQLQWVQFAAEAGHFGEVLTRVTGAWVKSLPDSGKGIAFEALGKALNAGGKLEQAEAAFKNAFQQYRAVQDLPGQTRALIELGRILLEGGQQSNALKYFEQAMAFAEKIVESHPALLGRVQKSVGQLYEGATDHNQAEKFFHQSIETLFHTGRYRLLAESYQALADLFLKMGEPDQAESYAKEALIQARFKGSHQILGQCLLLLAEIEEQRGNLGWVQERLQQGVVALKRAKLLLPYGQALIKRAYFFENNRQLDRAQKDAQEVLKLGEKAKNYSLIGQGRLVMGKVYRRDLEKLDKAYQEFDLASEAFSKSQALKFSWECEFEKGEIERNRSNSAQARPHYEAALRMIDEYVATVSPQVHEAFLKDGKRERIEMAIKWLD